MDSIKNRVPSTVKRFCPLALFPGVESITVKGQTFHQTSFGGFPYRSKNITSNQIIRNCPGRKGPVRHSSLELMSVSYILDKFSMKELKECLLGTMEAYHYSVRKKYKEYEGRPEAIPSQVVLEALSLSKAGADPGGNDKSWRHSAFHEMLCVRLEDLPLYMANMEDRKITRRAKIRSIVAHWRLEKGV